MSFTNTESVVNCCLTAFAIELEGPDYLKNLARYTTLQGTTYPLHTP